MSKIEGSIAGILSSYAVIINRGRKHGVAEGTQFLIYELDEPVLDPETKENLGRLEIHKGTVAAKMVQETICTAETEEEYTEETVYLPSVADMFRGLRGGHRTIRRRANQLSIKPEDVKRHYEEKMIVKVGDLVRQI